MLTESLIHPPRGEENLGKVLEIGGTEAWDFVKSKTKMLDWKFGI